MLQEDGSPSTHILTSFVFVGKFSIVHSSDKFSRVYIVTHGQLEQTHRTIDLRPHTTYNIQRSNGGSGGCNHTLPPEPPRAIVRAHTAHFTQRAGGDTNTSCLRPSLPYITSRRRKPRCWLHVLTEAGEQPRSCATTATSQPLMTKHI